MIFPSVQLVLSLLVVTPPGLHARALPQIHSPQVNVHRKERVEDLSWMWAYARPAPDGNENGLVNDPRFAPLLRRSFTAPQSFWGKEQPLAEAAKEFLGGPPGRLLAEDNRYLTADACVAHFCPDRGLLWVDMGTPHPLLVFAAIDWISDNKTVLDADSSYTMWVFSNRALDFNRLPAALVKSITRWTAEPSSGSTHLQNITRVYVVDPDGTPHPLSPAAIGAHNTLPPETSTGMKVPS